MLKWIVSLFLAVAGVISTWFVASDALNFAIVQMVIAVILLTLVIGLIAFWSVIKEWFKRK